MNQSISGRGLLLSILFSAAVGGAMGCSAAGDEPSASVSSTLGSPNPTATAINNWTDLTRMTSNGNYILKADINAAGKTWTALEEFSGTFDGGNKTISNLTINVTDHWAGGFFRTLSAAIVRNVTFKNLQVTSTYAAGGIAGVASDSVIESVRVEGTISSPTGDYVGGLVGMAAGTTFSRCSMKGSVKSARRFAGGITGYLNVGNARAEISESYVWATGDGIAPDTSEAGREVWSGGIVGWAFGAQVINVYAVGTVSGRGHAGGLVGHLGCDGSYNMGLHHGIYRGDVKDPNRGTNPGWEGTFGTYDNSQNCANHFDQLFWDKDLDGSTAYGATPITPQVGATNQQLTSPIRVTDGIFNYRDAKFESGTWEAGTETQHHALKNTPGGLTIQPRCVSNGVPSAC